MTGEPTREGEGLLACHECDYLHRVEPVPEGAKAVCVRCGALLFRHVPNSLDRSVALYLSALMLFIMANVYPIVSLKLGGEWRRTH